MRCTGKEQGELELRKNDLGLPGNDLGLPGDEQGEPGHSPGLTSSSPGLPPFLPSAFSMDCCPPPLGQGTGHSAGPLWGELCLCHPITVPIRSPLSPARHSSLRSSAQGRREGDFLRKILSCAWNTALSSTNSPFPRSVPHPGRGDPPERRVAGSDLCSQQQDRFPGGFSPPLSFFIFFSLPWKLLQDRAS